MKRNPKICPFCSMETSFVEEYTLCNNHNGIFVIFRYSISEYDLALDQYEITYDFKRMKLQLFKHNYFEGGCEICFEYDYFSYGEKILEIDFYKWIKPEEFHKTLDRLKKMVVFS